MSKNFSKSVLVTALVTSLVAPSFADHVSTTGIAVSDDAFDISRSSVAARREIFEQISRDANKRKPAEWQPAHGQKAVQKRIDDRLAAEEEERKQAQQKAEEEEAAQTSTLASAAKFGWSVAGPFIIPAGVRVAGDIFLSFAGDYLPPMAESIASSGVGSSIPGLSHVAGKVAAGETIRQMPVILEGAEKASGAAYLAGKKVVNGFTATTTIEDLDHPIAPEDTSELGQLRSQGLVSRGIQDQELSSLSPEERGEWVFVTPTRIQTRTEEDELVAQARHTKAAEKAAAENAYSARALRAAKIAGKLALVPFEMYGVSALTRIGGDYLLGRFGPYLAGRAGDAAAATFASVNKGWTRFVPGAETTGKWFARHTAKGEFYRNAGSWLDTAVKYAAPAYRLVKKSASTVKSAAVGAYEKAKPIAAKVANVVKSGFSKLGSAVSEWFRSGSSSKA